jgi:hypothetical protein
MLLREGLKLQVENDWSQRVREFRANSSLGKEYRKIESAQRDCSIGRLRLVQTGGVFKRMELAAVAFLAKWAAIVDRVRGSGAAPK